MLTEQRGDAVKVEVANSVCQCVCECGEGMENRGKQLLGQQQYEMLDWTITSPLCGANSPSLSFPPRSNAPRIFAHFNYILQEFLLSAKYLTPSSLFPLPSILNS